jgi:glycosyltransferase involved in cell wall biosynthesis
MPEPPQLSAISEQPISVVLLSCDNETTVESTLRGWIGALNRLKRDFEIVLVDDASVDRTVELAKGVAGRENAIYIHEQRAPAGPGAALRTGILAARYPLLLYSTADGSYSPQSLTACLEAIDNVHVVSGYRVWKSARPRRRLREVLTRLLGRIVFGVQLRDMDCAFKLFRREIFARIPIQSSGPFVHLEILAKANFLSLIMTELPVDYRPRLALANPRANWTRKRHDGWRVFSHPDFGPTATP